MIPLKQLLLICVLVGCGEREYTNTRDLKPNIPVPEPVAKTKSPLIAVPVVEEEIRGPFCLNKPTGELTMADLGKVTVLYLQACQLTDVKGLENLTQLEELNLNGNHITELPKGLEKLTQLKELLLQNNRLTSVKGLENLRQLKELNLSNNQLTDVKGLEKNTQLTELILSGNQLTDVKGLEKLTQLEILELENNPDLTKAQIDELKKALPKCDILSDHDC